MAKVLIVEDEDIIARMYQEALKFDGFDVTVALGGLDGLTKVKSEKPDVVLLDIMMPEPDGIEVLEKIKADPDIAGIPVVMLTNLSGKHDAELAKAKGALDYWVKCDVKVKGLGKKVQAILRP
ncbi:hypothetical protein A3A76_00090 [Candidatus Woesebacteria bacterium RIFCSPLOWO2_01_FULL_39_23]|uniref:Response regulatory domain-containing protein n=1 Tax=Candidatus Woesebacteria bacterium RIFCSPHIGHO2_01_FULL_40_22 TaxID=1802499 RepID=A0A1F7YHH2_9BACT|nr:MAG: hypothetical protein A2141_03060 [Candidatus Woesebacteria bacterium RBG_16_40_11]OGM26319.1 MAG: hypothetical protein A2628_03710 [Candidatus Woesebacteria bacterium RIFCSPHIGHO2_01_FULL_40_22]OGM36660.1 MAG: hypothetical protein A3E41_01935 [Candidatus Woesebacteria bacterium RIFCSPHIGHO2_12_FULL_38_9]OGM62874.1 MAG: hypothetical protein A3A76_00090 [Candidatus Woesebacteria bacterium RIFCSPLOWO2_01_FULL_39_23]